MSADLHDPSAYDPYGALSGNDVYMRYATSEVLSSGTNSVGENYYVLGWVTAPDPMTRERKLRVAITRDWPPWPACGSRSHSTFSDITDVNWVQRGGHMAAGQSGSVPYSAHGYLVWSDAGREDRPPEVAVARFWESGMGLSYERVFLERRAVPTHWYWGNPIGITPSMASNRPVPVNQDITSGEVASTFTQLMCVLARFPFPWGRLNPADLCDYGHRLLLVYSGDPRWNTEGQQKLEDPSCNWNEQAEDCRFWMGKTIRYKLFRPGDNRVLYQGTLADVRGYPDYDERLDHALYPEVVWNEAAQRWLVMWEERYHDPDQLIPGHYSFWKARTVDLQGNLGPTSELGWCQGSVVPTSHQVTGDVREGDDGKDPGGDDDDPSIVLKQQSYCYPLNLANDYYSLDGIDVAGDRNPGHYSLFSNYLAVAISGAQPFEWIDDTPPDGPVVEDNLSGPLQTYSGESNLMNIGVIGRPDFRDRTDYKDASYLKMSSNYDPGYGCQDVFYLISHDPEATHTEGVEQKQQYYRVEGSTWDHDCSSRHVWSVSSSIIGFVALYAQYVPTERRYEMRYSTYLWVP